MIETEQTVVIGAAIDSVWDYVRDMTRWASIMPGYRECAVIDANESRWTLKVGAGGLVRTVKVLVHVDQWDGPGRVDFSYKLEGDPVEGSGSYVAAPNGTRETQVTLRVRVEGSGPVAPLWEAMGKPLLPQFAKSFAGQLKTEIEKTVAAPESQAAPVTGAPSVFAVIRDWLQKAWRTLFGSRAC